ncbi:hypothetical protein PCE1_003075 [Barthelona sp. PCE]
MLSNASYRIVFVGDSSTGKSCLFHRLSTSQFLAFSSTTVNVAFRKFEIFPGHFVSFLDTAGCETFRALSKSFYREAKIALILYDVTRFDSYDNVRTWHENIINETPDAKIIILGNKSDLLETDQAPNWTEGIKEEHMLISAKSGHNIDRLLERIRELYTEDVTKDDISKSEELLQVDEEEDTSICRC